MDFFGIIYKLTVYKMQIMMYNINMFISERKITDEG